MASGDSESPAGVQLDGRLYSWEDLIQWSNKYDVIDQAPDESNIRWARKVVDAHKKNTERPVTDRPEKLVRVRRNVLEEARKGKGKAPANSISTEGATIDGVFYDWDQIEGWGDQFRIVDPATMGESNEQTSLTYAEIVVAKYKEAQAQASEPKVKPKERRISQREKLERADWANPIEKDAPWWRYVRGVLVDGVDLCMPCAVMGDRTPLNAYEMSLYLLDRDGTPDFHKDELCDRCGRQLAPTNPI